jgi:hypothetical protein
MPRAIYTSHNIGSSKCTQLSAQDRNKLNNHLSHMVCEDEIDDRQLAAASKTKMLFILNWTLEPPSVTFVKLRLLCCVVKYSLMISCQHLVMD